MLELHILSVASEKKIALALRNRAHKFSRSGDEPRRKGLFCRPESVHARACDTSRTELSSDDCRKHMTAKLDLDGNKRMDRFFNEWVYGTKGACVQIEYALLPEGNGSMR